MICAVTLAAAVVKTADSYGSAEGSERLETTRGSKAKGGYKGRERQIIKENSNAGEETNE